MNFRHRRLHRLVSVWKYLQESRYAETMMQQCSASLSAKQDGILTLLVPVDLMQLSEMDSDVANCVTCTPLEGAMLFREVILEVLIAKGLVKDDSDMTQVVVSLRITSGTLPQLSLTGSQDRLYSGYFKVRGVILGVTATVTYTKSTKYKCPRENCDGHSSNQYVRIHIPGASEKETVRQRFKCSVCLMSLVEDKSRRTLSEKLLAEVIPVHLCGGNCDYMQTGSRHQAVKAIVRDGLCQQLTLGQQCEMIGTQRMDVEGENIACMFEVNNLIPVVSDLVYQQLSQDSILAVLPESVQHLYSEWGKTPYVFPKLTALRLADDVIPPFCFFKLKLLLLISLVLTPEVPPLHILAVCSESHLIQRLMDFCSELAFTSIRHSSLATLGAKASASRYMWAPYFVQAGSLLLASGGVCHIGDIHSMKRADRIELQSVLIESRVLVTLEARHTGSLPHVQTLPLSCQVWAHTTSNMNNTGNSSAADNPYVLFDAFNIVCHCDVTDAASTDVTEELVSFLLESHSSGADRDDPRKKQQAESESYSPVSKDDMKKYIAVARAQKSVMTVEAEWLMTSYLIAARHARSSASQFVGTAVPVSAMQTLQALAHGFCRLSLRKQVLEVDALMAVYLYEEALTARHGMSGLSVFPEPHLPASSAQTYITTQIPAAMSKFHSRLLSFCAGPSHSVTVEE